MTALLIDSGIETAADLAGLLPDSVRARIAPEMLTEAPTAAALRVLATIKHPGWHEHVGAVRIAWEPLLAWARDDVPRSSVRVRVEVAASLAGRRDARVSLLHAARELDRGNLLAVMDALRIAAEGVAR